jgi:signal transduction histidine kinase
VNLGKDQQTALILVSDTGIGIARADIPQVFDQFWRADKARLREQGGAGLGLSIAKWIVEMHHFSRRHAPDRAIHRRLRDQCSPARRTTLQR